VEREEIPLMQYSKIDEKKTIVGWPAPPFSFSANTSAADIFTTAG
jgi:hypothetical protein